MAPSIRLCIEIAGGKPENARSCQALARRVLENGPTFSEKDVRLGFGLGDDFLFLL